MARENSRRLEGRACRWALASAALVLAAPSSHSAGPCDAYPTGDAPALSQPGALSPGRRALRLEAAADRGDTAQHVPPRALAVLVWYPAVAGDCSATEPYRQVLRRHAWRPLPVEQVEIAVPAVAVDGAAVAGDQRFPVVLLSHGLLGWASALTYLGEHLASRGYVVVAIDHQDEAESALDPLQSALAFRSADQLTVVSALQEWNRDPRHFLHERLAMDRVALVGYSMGGFGALRTAGGQESWLKGVVAIAPWGGQSHVGAIDRATLDSLVVPTFFIAGDHDDVSGFKDGTQSLFEGASKSDRWLLVYENARHNVGGYPLPGVAMQVPALQSFFVDPVWRIERIQAVNRHFVTAFLDYALKADGIGRNYLEPPTTRSNDGRWPTANPFDLSDPLADAGSAPGFWPGFRRRSALGLQLLHLAPGQTEPNP